jgi:geranylgeranylglycerol-phosphate geranylgeranyltransferase
MITVPQHLPFALSGGLSGILLSHGTFTIHSGLAVLAVMCLVSGYNTFNCAIDHNIDAINKPHRPIPSGILTPRAAIIYAGLLYSIGLILARVITPAFLCIYVGTVGLSIVYSLPPLQLKKRLLVNNVAATVLYGVLFPLLGWAVQPYNPVPLSYLLFFGLLGYGLSIAKDFEDVAGDA